MLRVGHDGDATMPYLIQQEGNVSGAGHCCGPWLMPVAIRGPRRRRGGGPARRPRGYYHSRAAVLRDSRWVHLVRSRIPVWLMTRLEDADENRRAAEIRTLGVNGKHGRTGRLPRGRRR